MGMQRFTGTRLNFGINGRIGPNDNKGLIPFMPNKENMFKRYKIWSRFLGSREIRRGVNIWSDN
jgi:hypothetical protein